MTVNRWIEENYEEILQWAKNACQQWTDSEDLAHYAIAQFIEHEKAQDLVDKGHARWFIVRILLNSSRSKKSQYWRIYRRSHQELVEQLNVTDDELYNHELDVITESIWGILEDLEHGDAAEWYNSTVFQLCLEQEKLNFSKLSRETGIPRTSIANAYYETIEWIKIKLEEYGKHFNVDIRDRLSDLLGSAD